jgi:hypothetical protein
MKDIEAIKSRIIHREEHPLIDKLTVYADDFEALLAKIDELESCLRWYVEEDDTNMTQPSNEYWIEGKHRAMRALGMEEG